MAVVKLDEALSRMLIELFRSRGHAVRSVREQGWGGMSDSLLWPRIQAEDVFFVTTDKDFGDIRVYPPGTHGGILVLRPARESLLYFKSLIEDFLTRHSLKLTGQSWRSQNQKAGADWPVNLGLTG
jgi:predicted nuclease of predicted toxin-antitoxin system